MRECWDGCEERAVALVRYLHHLGMTNCHFRKSMSSVKSNADLAELS